MKQGLRRLICVAAASALVAAAIPAAAEDGTTITGLETGYYDLTATFENTSVDGSCYMWAESAASTRGKTALPESTDTSGTTVTVKGIYTNDGTITYGLYNDGKSTARISDVKAVRAEGAETFLNGGYITSYNYAYDNGGRFYDLDGKEVDGIEYLGSMGMNAARIRVVNNPGKGRGGDGSYHLPEGYKDRADCLELAKKAVAAEMDIVYSFNYSDYWADAEKQRIPADWVAEVKNSLGYDIESASFLNSMTSTQKSQIVEKLGELLYNYTYDVTKELVDNGAAPKYVSLGNEINAGILFPFANTYDTTLSLDTFKINESSGISAKADWASLVKLLNRGYDAVKAAAPEAEVIIHLADGGIMWNIGKSNENSSLDWWFDPYIKAGGKVDVIGASYYPSWSDKTASECKYFCDWVTDKYNRDIMIMETGYNWNGTRKDGNAGQLSAIDAYKSIYPDTPSGHKGFMTELINYMKLAKRCIGVIYWDPMMIHVEDSKGVNRTGWAIEDNSGEPEVNVVENTTLFDFSGKAIPTVKLYDDTRSAKARACIEITVNYNDDGTLKDTKLTETTADKAAPSKGEKTRTFVWYSFRDMIPVKK